MDAVVRKLVPVGVFAAIFLTLSPPVTAATFTVSKNADTSDGTCDADCSLREAITAANALGGTDIIVFDGGVTGTITLGSSLPTITETLTITGPGAALLTVDADSKGRIVQINSATDNQTLTISALTLTGGLIVNGNGGAINVEDGETVNLSDCVITNNVADNAGSSGNGGAIDTRLITTLTITNCTFSNNTADFGAGAIRLLNGGTATISNSTFSGNNCLGCGGGAINSTSATLNLRNSTFSGNQGNGGGGAINTGGGGTANLSNVTITNNAITSGNGGGIAVVSGTANIKNTVIAGNTDNGGEANDCSGTINSQDFNLIQDTGGCTINGTTTHNITGQDPLLEALDDNGGSTQTHALQLGSPAIDGGNTAGCKAEDASALNADQRGVNRLGVCDIGAYEYSCGDGDLQVHEVCDDGNAFNTDACLTTCMAASCGDGFVQTGVEGCDDANGVNDDACLTTCVVASCGDGFIQTGVEGCDDGNTSNADACLDTCVVASCGDGFVQAGVEGCDDGNASNDDACLSSCVSATCGDGVIQSSVEMCDNGTANSDTLPDACRSTCALAVCGDGTTDSTEECDDGSDNSETMPDACRSDCVSASCGDGTVDSTEECDDSNEVGDDLCGNTCLYNLFDDLEEPNPLVNFSDLKVGDTIIIHSGEPTEAIDPAALSSTPIFYDCDCSWNLTPESTGTILTMADTCQTRLTIESIGVSLLSVTVDCGSAGLGVFKQTITSKAEAPAAGGGAPSWEGNP